MRCRVPSPTRACSLPRLFRAAGTLLLLIAALSCSSRNIHQDIGLRAPRVRTIGILLPQAAIYQLSAGGQVQLIEDWTSQGRNNLLAAAVEQLAPNRVRLVMLEPDPGASLELDEVLPLFEAVSAGMSGRSHGGMPAFGRRPDRYDHSVGPLDRILAPRELDAMLVMTAYDEISTAGRKALIALGKVTGILFGDPPSEGATFLTMALLDRDGAVLWRGELQDRGGYDLRRPGSARAAVRSVLETYPGALR